MVKCKALLLIIVLLFFAHHALARSMYEVTCTNKGCEFKSEIGMYDGFKFEQVSGYCTACKKPTSVSWSRRKAPHKPLAEVWGPASNQMRRLYKCP